MKRLVCSLIPFFLTLAVLGQDPKAELPEDPVLAKLQKASVTVKAPTGTGSGNVILQPKTTTAWVLTAAHVVDDLRSLEKGRDGKEEVRWGDAKVYQIRTFQGRITGKSESDAEVMRMSRDDDIALLRVRDDSFQTGVTLYLGKTIPPVGTSIFHVGSPLGDFGSCSVTKGIVSQHGRVIDREVLDQCNISAFPGSSGGMVTLTDGRLIGIVVRGREGGFTLMTPVRKITDFLKKEQLEFLVDPEKVVPSEEELQKQRAKP